MNGLFTLASSDFTKGAVTAFLTAIITSLYGILTTVGFDFFSADWKQVSVVAIGAGISAFLGYISKNFLSTNNDKLLGKVQM